MGVRLAAAPQRRWRRLRLEESTAGAEASKNSTSSTAPLVAAVTVDGRACAHHRYCFLGALRQCPATRGRPDLPRGTRAGSRVVEDRDEGQSTHSEGAGSTLVALTQGPHRSALGDGRIPGAFEGTRLRTRRGSLQSAALGIARPTTTTRVQRSSDRNSSVDLCFAVVVVVVAGAEQERECIRNKGSKLESVVTTCHTAGSHFVERTACTHWMDWMSHWGRRTW